MKDCDINKKFNCSPYVKYIFFAFVLVLAMMSCKQEVRVENDDFFSDAVILIENEFDSKIIDRNTGNLITNDLFENNSQRVQTNVDKVYSYQNELYFLLKSENKIKVYNQTNFMFVTEYDFNGIGEVSDIAFPNVSNFYVTLSDKNEVLVVDRINQKLSQFYIPVDNNPKGIHFVGNLVFVSCENSINIIRTGTKEVIKKIVIQGRSLLFSNDLSNESLIVISEENTNYYLTYFSLVDFSELTKTQLTSEFLETEEQLIVNQIAIVNNDLEYSWLGTSVGLFRIDLRNQGVYTFMSERKENIKNIYFEPISNRILILSNRNGNNDYIIANSRTGVYMKYTPLSTNAKLIFPL